MLCRSRCRRSIFAQRTRRVSFAVLTEPDSQYSAIASLCFATASAQHRLVLVCVARSAFVGFVRVAGHFLVSDLHEAHGPVAFDSEGANRIELVSGF